MIKNTMNAQRVPLRTILGDVPADALDLVEKLLIFNPHRRLNAEEALEHPYVSRFHDREEEISLPCSVVIPLNDDVRLSVDDYRNKLYELMSEASNAHMKTSPSSHMKYSSNSTIRITPNPHIKTSLSQGRISPNRIRTSQSPGLTRSNPTMHMSQKGAKIEGVRVDVRPTKIAHVYDHVKYFNRDRPQYSEQGASRTRSQMTNKTETKLAKHVIVYPERLNTTKHTCLVDGTGKDKTLKRRVHNTHHGVYKSFNSYNQNHGIITQSALVELRGGFR